MTLLLDTHVLLWWLDNPALLADEARKLIESTANSVYISAASFWEITIKKQLGKLNIPDNLLEVIITEQFEHLPINFQHALAVEKLPDIHKNPFDRLLIAQSRIEGLTLITRDSNIFKYKIDLIKA